jgi:hypothetical protein
MCKGPKEDRAPEEVGEKNAGHHCYAVFRCHCHGVDRSWFPAHAGPDDRSQVALSGGPHSGRHWIRSRTLLRLLGGVVPGRNLRVWRVLPPVGVRTDLRKEVTAMFFSHILPGGSDDHQVCASSDGPLHYTLRSAIIDL